MNVWGIPVDLYWLLQFVGTAVVIALGLLHLVKSTASKYFVVDANFAEGGEGSATGEGGRRKSQEQMLAVTGAGDGDGDGCAGCGSSANKKCSGCKVVRYCSENCQLKHWKAGHKLKCKELKLFALNSRQNPVSHGGNTTIQQIKKVLLPYEEFVKLFNWERPGLPPCGLLNCGNSCFANVVLQCLSCTRPLVAYLLEKDHRRECRRNDWCFLCELQTHVQRARQSLQPFSPLNILSRLPNIGGNLGYGKQEDAHEFMRFAIDTMQSVCLDEFGGEKSLHPSSQETTLIQCIFGGHLQSQVTCTKCEKISYKNENMMDLTVEIQGDAVSLEDCLDQFTAQEWLDGENMYKCDGCNDYVKACKRLTICRAPNVLTIALKRFQSGRFGKLNKRVSFPETLNLSPYMSKSGDGRDLYRLYAVVVHIDMLNASFFGHYICYTKDFDGNWYRIDDYKVAAVDLEEVLSQGAYMLLYCRTSVRPSCTNPLETLREVEQLVEVIREDQPCSNTNYEQGNSLSSIPSGMTSPMTESCFRREDSVDMDQEVPIRVKHTSSREYQQDHDLINPESSTSGSEDFDIANEHSDAAKSVAITQIVQNLCSSSRTSSLVQVHTMEPEVSSTGSDVECSLEDGDGSGGNFNKESVCSEPKDDCLPIESDIHDMAEKPRSDDNSKLVTSFLSVPIPRLEQEVAVELVKELPAALDREVKTSKLDAGSPCSRSELKPLFSPGFLDKSTRCKSLNINGRAQVGPHEVGRPCKVASDCNGSTKSSSSNEVCSEVGDNHGALDLDCQRTPDTQSNKFLNGNGFIGDQLPVDCRYDNLHAAEVASPAELACEVAHSPLPLTESSSVYSNGLKHETNGRKYDRDHCVKNGNGFALNELETPVSLSGENSSHEISVPVATSVAVNRSNLAFSSHLPNPRLDQQVACSSGALIKSSFPGFLDKPYQNGNGSQMEICENGVSDCNGYVKSAFLHQNSCKINVLDGIFLDCNGQSTSGFIETQNCLDEDGVTNEVLGETGKKKPVYCNGNAGFISDKDKKISLVNHGNGTFLENDKPMLSPPGFHERSVKKKSHENDVEGREASEIVSSVHDRIKLPRVG